MKKAKNLKGLESQADSTTTAVAKHDFATIKINVTRKACKSHSRSSRGA
ncbi:hypothetical protein [Helicobacter bilis]|nr:hypothetical protein [Helicobacter bilis]